VKVLGEGAFGIHCVVMGRGDPLKTRKTIWAIWVGYNHSIEKKKSMGGSTFWSDRMGRSAMEILIRRTSCQLPKLSKKVAARGTWLREKLKQHN